MSGIERTSQTWVAVEAWLKSQALEDATRLQRFGVGVDDANRLRGRIELAQDLLKHAEPAKPAIPTHEEAPYLP